MTISNRQKALLHVAKAKLGLDEAEYRSILAELAGVTSSAELDQDGFNLTMAFFEWKGFTPLKAKGPDYGNRPGMATCGQIALIRTLWSEYAGTGATDGLNTWLHRCFKVSSLRFLTLGDGQRVITALKAMKARRA